MSPRSNPRSAFHGKVSFEGLQGSTHPPPPPSLQALRDYESATAGMWPGTVAGGEMHGNQYKNNMTGYPQTARSHYQFDDNECPINDMRHFCAFCGEAPESSRTIKYCWKPSRKGQEPFIWRKAAAVADVKLGEGETERLSSWFVPGAKKDVFADWLPGLGMPLEEAHGAEEVKTVAREPVDVLPAADSDSDVALVPAAQACGTCGRDFAELKTIEGPGFCVGCRAKWLQMFNEEKAEAARRQQESVRRLAEKRTRFVRMRKALGRSRFNWELFQATGCFDVL